MKKQEVVSPDFEQKRLAARDRKRRSREKARTAAQKPQNRFEAYCVRWNVIGFNQLAPGCPGLKNTKACPLKTCPHLTKSVDESLAIARLFARAGRAAQAAEKRFVGKDFSEPHEGETIRQFTERTYRGLTVEEGKEFVERLLNQTTWKLDAQYEVVSPKLWESTWEGEADVVIDVANLPALPGEPKPPKPVRGVWIGEKFVPENSEEY